MWGEKTQKERGVLGKGNAKARVGKKNQRAADRCTVEMVRKADYKTEEKKGNIKKGNDFYSKKQ